MGVHFLAVEGSTVGITTLAGALVVAIGYMLTQSRDSDRRVDTSHTEVVDTLRAQLENERTELARERKECREERDQFEVERKGYRKTIGDLRQTIDDLRERIRILHFRLSQYDKDVEQ